MVFCVASNPKLKKKTLQFLKLIFLKKKLPSEAQAWFPNVHTILLELPDQGLLYLLMQI